MRLEHANLTVSDLERSIAFFRAALGFEVRWRGTTSDPTQEAAHVGPPGEAFYLSLFEAETPGRARYDYSAPGLNHVGLVVEDLDAARKRVEASGAEVHLAADYDPGRRFYFLDPDGIEFELVQY
jgi:catechol 2,3-dioxygenase-like lactoylglutathione lyase family enzyme